MTVDCRLPALAQGNLGRKGDFWKSNNHNKNDGSPGEGSERSSRKSMWSKYCLARPVARYPACVYLPLSPDETTWGEQPTARRGSSTGQPPGGLISSLGGGPVHSNDLTARCHTLGSSQLLSLAYQGHTDPNHYHSPPQVGGVDASIVLFHSRPTIPGLRTGPCP